MEFPIEKIKGFPAATLLYFLSAITSGLLFIYVFNKHLFFSLDAFRLCCLSLAICLPVIGINTFVAFWGIQKILGYVITKNVHNQIVLEQNLKATFWNSEIEDYHHQMSLSIYFGSLFSTINFSIITYSSYLNKIPLHRSITKLTILELVYVFLAFIIRWGASRETKKIERKLYDLAPTLKKIIP